MVLSNIDYHICDTCNLKCVSCNHYSPLAPSPKMVSVDKAEADFGILHKWRDRFEMLTVLGGEALLNKDAEAILETAACVFPNRVKLITNGVMADRLSELSWVIRSYGIRLVITEYPFKEGWEEHYARLREEFPEAVFYKYRVEHGFLRDHLSYTETGVSDAEVYRCDKRLKCCNYIDGRLYICHYAAFLPFLKTVTDTGFENDDAYIDLRFCSPEEFDRFFSVSVPEICRHCLYVTKPYEEHRKQPWKRSGLDPSEWIS